MKIILIDPKNELILNSVNIEKISDAQRLIYYWKKEERERAYQVERVLVYGGTIRIMDPEEPIHVPPKFPGQCLDNNRVVYG